MSDRNRSRSNSRSQVVAPPSFAAHQLRPKPKDKPRARPQAEHYVTLVSLNDTFTTKHIHVPLHPETARLGRPTGTKVKPHVTNGYFDSRVLSRNHACMFVSPETGLVMVQDMGSSNGTFVNSEKLGADPVAVRQGDVINLGFNIQVETNHKQISARVESINVVSNSPGGLVSERLPRLTKSAVDGFSDDELKHYDFIQGLISQMEEKKSEGASENSDKSKSEKQTKAEIPTKADKPDRGAEKEETDDSSDRPRAKAFDAAMFADLVPTLDDSFAAATNPNLNAGIFKNSHIVYAPELRSAVDSLTVTLARVKQQNASLRSVESFLANYSANVSDINAQHVRGELSRVQQEAHAELSSERQKSAQTISDQAAKLAAQYRAVAALESEVQQLKREKEKAVKDQKEKESKELELKESESKDSESKGSESKARESQLHRGFDAVSLSDFEPKDTSPKTSKSASKPDSSKVSNTPAAPEPWPTSLRPDSQTNSSGPVSSRSLQSKEIAKTASKAESTQISRSSSRPEDLHPYKVTGYAPFVDHMQNMILQYKNQGVAVGFFVVVAGFLYQNTKQ